MEREHSDLNRERVDSITRKAGSWPRMISAVETCHGVASRNWSDLLWCAR